MEYKLLKFFLGLFLALLFLLLTFKNVAWVPIKNILISANLTYILIGLIFFIIGFCFRIERWKIILLCENSNLKFKNCFGPFFSSFALNNILPLRAGDLARSFLFNKQLKVSSGTVIISLVFERVLDLVTIIFFLGIILNLISFEINYLFKYASYILTIIAISCLIIIYFPIILIGVIKTIKYQFSKIFPRSFSRINDQFEKSIKTIKFFNEKKVFKTMICYSILAWLFEGAFYFFIGLSLFSLNDSLSSILVFPISTLSTLIPSTPGYVGTFDFFTSKTLIISGFTTSMALSYTILIHFLLWFPTTIIGSLFLIFNKTKIFNKSLFSYIKN